MTFDPLCKYDLWLDCFNDATADERPVFTFRRLNGAEYLQLLAVFDLVGQPARECAAQLLETLAVGLIDWRNQVDLESGEAAAFDPAKLDRLIDPAEVFELIEKRIARRSQTIPEGATNGG